MSTSLDGTKSPKKRKIESDTVTKSKKRRKQNDSQTDQHTFSSQLPLVNKKISKHKSKEKLQEDVIPDEDVEMVNGTDQVTQPSQHAENLTPLENGAQDSPGPNDDLVTDDVVDTDETLLMSQNPTCFYSKRLSLYIPIPAVSLATSVPSLLSLHLSPLLLTYFPPVGGIVLSFSDPVLSAKAERGVNLPLQPPKSGDIPPNPLDETFAQCADQYGVCWAWLTATFLVFAPHPGDQFDGWANVQSESFIGLVSYNYFQTSVLKNRIPKKWSFNGPSREQKQKRKPKKERLQGSQGNVAEVESSQAQEAAVEGGIDSFDGSFVDDVGNKVSQKQTIRVNDIDMTPGNERNKFGLQIDGSLLSIPEEQAVLAEEKRQYDANRKRRSRSQTPAVDDEELPTMSGGIPLSRDISVA